MSNAYTELNPGSGGSIMDETGVTYGAAPVLRRRTRLIIAGEGINEICQVKNTNLDGSEYGLVVRSLPTAPANSVLEFDTNNAVSDSLETTLVSYTVPGGANFYFSGIVTQGDLPAVYRVYVDSSCKLSFRTTSSNPCLSQSFNLPPFSAVAASVVTLKVTHFISGVTGEFEGSILGYTV